MARDTAQLTLSLFDSTSLAGGMTLTGEAYRPLAAPEPDDEPTEALGDPVPAGKNFHLLGDRGLARGWKARAADNLAAITLAARIEAEKRPASEDEQAMLARFVGFGAADLANSLFRRRGGEFAEPWLELGEELEQLVSREDLASLARATQYAHYTPEFLIRAIWRSLGVLGFEGGRVLEPGCGTGLFFALMPEAMAAASDLTGIEFDRTTARIAQLLFPAAWIRHEDFTKARLPERYDLVIGNPPFSDRTVRAEDPAGRLHLSLHDYFIARAIERLKPGGIAAFVTSRWTLDKTDPKARAHIAELASLVGAVRLPEGSFAAAAGTDVVIDVLLFQRRGPETTAPSALWDTLAEAVPAGEGEEALSINRYFIEHPDQVLGRHARTTGPFGPTYSCLAHGEGDLEAALDRAFARIVTGVRAPRAEPIGEQRAARPAIGTAAEGAVIKEGSYVILDHALHQILDGTPTPVAIRQAGCAGIPAKHARIIRGLIPVRDAIRELLRAQEAGVPWGAAQVRLRVAYGGFVRQFGPINLTSVTESVDPTSGATRESVRYPNLQPFADDPDVWLVASIESYDLESGRATCGPIFTQRVIHPPALPLVETVHDALAVTLHEVGIVDLDRIAELVGRTREQARAELGEAVFLDPALSREMEIWQTADAYLSGPVRTKLAVARAAAALDGRYQRNVAALERVQPEDLRPSDICARLGAPWVPAEIVEQFSAEVIGIATAIRHTVEIAAWTIDTTVFAGQAAATSEWGTSRRHAGLLLSDALNASLPAIYDVWTADGVEHRELNAPETEAAKEKLQKIRGAFEHWAWKDADRTERLARIYNDRFNNLMPRQFDGGHLSLPGASSVIRFYPHQKRVIWRIIAAGSTYVAHAVGAGKTFSLAAAVMEQKRLGLITKAMMVVPGHCLAQASREFLLLYPSARILVADETNFTKDKRQRFLARAATAQWDCIIITHAAFKFIPAPASFERVLIDEELAGYADLLERLDGDDRIGRKRIERLKEGLEAKLEALKTRKDDLLTIGEIGIDQIIVDESQEFRKLSFATNMGNLKGVDPDGSQRAWDLWVKSRYVARRNPGRALILASGTPITNTLGEMFTLQRFMQLDALVERGIHEFDAWAGTFGETLTELELQPSGQYKPETRFAAFVNVADLMALYRAVADVVLKDDLRQHVRLPAIRGGKRQMVTAAPSAAFKAYQQVLGDRIERIRKRKGKVQKGDDILLSVITDGRHAAIDMRFVLPGSDNEPENKLNALVANAHRIWLETSDRRYTRLDGTAFALAGGAQMIFSDLGTLNVEATRGFSAYRWIRDRLAAHGVPPGEIAFMQDYKKSSAKQRLFADVNAGKVRILIGSSETMGTGVNAQRRLVALHHLDVPWLPSQIEQREGRIERQGNENEEIQLYAYATTGSVDAAGWQRLERKARFIGMAMAGDRSIRRLEDAGSQASQFALAKAIASGDPRLMQKAGLEAELARLERLRAAHIDDQHAVRRAIATAENTIAASQRRITRIRTDIAQRRSTRGEAFVMAVDGRQYAERKDAGAALLKLLRALEIDGAKVAPVGSIGGFALTAVRARFTDPDQPPVALLIERTDHQDEVEYGREVSPLGIIARLEHQLTKFEVELADAEASLADAQDRLPGYRQRLGRDFAYQDELDTKQTELAALERSLAAGEPQRPEPAEAA
ncbi:MAG TPA: N-6 DNA methylase [Aliidongia sp.]|uniref:N-6 DNA methylase n=1 Tax=Aliidongia sp. TaxID=1914230 RepID=UPI002DDD205F|nr:N-6 DNA methylase [Aliidongia sp.]HEV2673329.1 N-6 DNA methylase [Aliidongia sp.]